MVKSHIAPSNSIPDSHIVWLLEFSLLFVSNTLLGHHCDIWGSYTCWSSCSCTGAWSFLWSSKFFLGWRCLSRASVIAFTGFYDVFPCLITGPVSCTLLGVSHSFDCDEPVHCPNPCHPLHSSLNKCCLQLWALEHPDSALSHVIPYLLSGGFSFWILTFMAPVLIPFPVSPPLQHLDYQDVELHYHMNLMNILSWPNAHYFLTYGSILWWLAQVK